MTFSGILSSRQGLNEMLRSAYHGGQIAPLIDFAALQGYNDLILVIMKIHCGLMALAAGFWRNMRPCVAGHAEMTAQMQILPDILHGR